MKKEREGGRREGEKEGGMEGREGGGKKERRERRREIGNIRYRVVTCYSISVRYTCRTYYSE